MNKEINSHRVFESNSSSFTTDSDIDLPKQNFSAILNNPLSKNYLSKLKQKIKKPIVIPKNEFKKEILKFSIIDIFQNDNLSDNNITIKKEKEKEEQNKKHKKKKSVKEKNDKSTTSSEDSSINQKTFQIKDYINKNYDDYLKILNHDYSSFHYNHYNRMIFENNTLQEIKEEMSSKNYISNSEHVFDKIEPRFLVDERIYKLDEKLLQLSPSELQFNICKLIEQTGIIEIELERINEYNYKIRNYINNLEPNLYKNITSFYEIVKFLKVKNQSIKKNYILVSSKLILKKNKQAKLKKMKFILEQIKEFNDIYNNREINNLDKASKIIESIPKLNIIKELRNNIDLLIASKNDSLVEEIEKLISDSLNNLFTISEENNMNKGEYYKIDDKLFSEINEFKINMKPNLTLKINEINNISDIQEKFFTASFSQYIKNKLLERFVEFNCDTLKSNILKILSLKNKNEILYIFYLSQFCQNEFELMKKIFNKNENNEFFNTLKTKLIDNFTSIISQHIKVIFDEIKNYLNNVTEFLVKNHLIKEIFNNSILKNNLNISQRIEEYEEKYIIEYSKEKENKLIEGIKFDNFIPLDNVPYTYQIYINKINDFNILKVGSYENTIKFFEITIDKEKENEKLSSLQLPNNSQIKIIPTSFEIITYTFETLKMLSSFSINNYSKILISLSSILKLYAQLNKIIVIESKGHLVSITQNEISICYYNYILIQQLITIMYNNDTNKFLNQFSGGIFDKLYNEINIIIVENEKSLKIKIDQLTQQSLQECIHNFVKIISGKNYPIVNNPELPINEFALSLIKIVKAIYRATINSFGKEYIKEMLKKNLENFVNDIENKINNIIIDGDDEKKQFKKDFVFIKKNIDNNIDDLNLENFKNKITIISKKFFPKEKKKNKKHKEKGEEKEDDK